MSGGVLYKLEWQVLLCTECGFCLRPGRDVWLRHLRQKPHCLRGAPLKALVELFGSYDLLAPEQVVVPTQAVAGLRLLDGFQVPDVLGGPYAELLDHPAARVQGTPAEASTAQEEPPLAGVQAADLLCRDPPRPVFCRRWDHGSHRRWHKELGCGGGRLL
ncbi:hypothetical protein BGZ57DRAFT_898318 [Hyaloscypha finlandica]|nr:hypothetical protein BGZ57DRAFT_898318 [Hyaloscypha finlandica]